LDEEGKVLGEITRSQPTGPTARQLDTVYQHPTSSSSLTPLGVQTSVQENSVPALHIRFLTRSLKLALDSSITRLDVVRTHPLHCIPPRDPFLRAERCVRTSRGGDARPRRPTPTHWRLGTRSPADGARGACRQRSDLRGVGGIARSEPGLPAMHIICSGCGHQPSLLNPRPIIPSCLFTLPAYTPSSPHSIASSSIRTTPAHRASVNIRCVSTSSSLIPTPSSPSHSFLLLRAQPSTPLCLPIPPPSILLSSLSRDSNAVTHVGAADTRTCLCARGSRCFVDGDTPQAASREVASEGVGQGPTHLAALVRRGGCGAGLDVPEPYSPAFGMWSDALSSAGVLVAAHCPLSVHPSTLLSFFSFNLI
jgi:hypothetical protein